MTGTYDRVELLTSVQRRRRWASKEKIQIVEETNLPGNTVLLVARQHGILPTSAVHSAQADDLGSTHRSHGG